MTEFKNGPPHLPHTRLAQDFIVYLQEPSLTFCTTVHVGFTTRRAIDNGIPLIIQTKHMDILHTLEHSERVTRHFCSIESV